MVVATKTTKTPAPIHAERVALAEQEDTNMTAIQAAQAIALKRASKRLYRECMEEAKRLYPTYRTGRGNRTNREQASKAA